MSSAPEELLESVLAHALELRAEGREDWLEEATHDFPHLRDQIRAAAADTDLMATWLNEGPAGDPDLGRTLGGRFRLSQRIGAGAMGVVYLAEDLQLVRPVAVKVLRGGLVDTQHAMRRLLREAEAMAAVQHPSIITIHDRGQTEQQDPYIVMEWLDGVPLNVLVEQAVERAGATGVPGTAWLAEEYGIDTRGERNFARLAVTWIADLANGLSQVHGAGVQHRDIKPSNIIVRKTGFAVLLDFGLALLDQDSTLTRGVTSVGTPSYMPPEALVRGRLRGPAGDIYSLGSTLYHLLALRAPYSGTPSEVLAALATSEPKPANRVRPGLPRDLQAILEKAMQRKPQQRYASVTDLEADLRAFLDFRPVSVRPMPAWARLLRRAGRSKAARGVLATLLVLGALALAQAVRTARAAELEREALAVRQALPPNLTTVLPANRAFRDPADRSAVAALLDRGVELGVDGLIMRQLRTSFRIDHGDFKGAASDMQWIADELGTPFSAALAARYAALDAAVDPAVDGLPEPTTGEDRYVLATHLLRAERYAEGDALLAEPSVRALWHGEELRLMGVPFEGLTTPERMDRARAAFADVLELERRIGARTAATAHIGGRFQTVMQRYRTSVELLEEGVALAPRSHTIRINAGYAAFIAGDAARAKQHLTLAIELRPGYTKPLTDLMWVHVGQGEFDAAATLVREAPLETGDAAAHWRAAQLAYIETYRALAHFQAGHKSKGELATESARAHLDAADALRAPKPSALREVLAGLETGDLENVYLGLADFVLDDPIHSWALGNLIATMPPELDAEATAATRRLLESFQAPEAARPDL